MPESVAPLEPRGNGYDPLAVECECGNYYTLHMHTVCPQCAAFPKRCKFCGGYWRKDRDGYCRICVEGMARTNGD